MKSRTKKSKTRVLIAFGKGIASTLALELAMLFWHGGAEVRAAIIDNGNEWVSEASLKQICGHSALTISHQPGWFFAGLKFDAGIVIGPSSLTQQQLASGITADPLLDYIKTSCLHLSILQTRPQLPPDSDSFGSNIIFQELPAQPLRLNQFFQKIFSETTSRVAARALLRHCTAAVTYEVPHQLNSLTGLCPAWLAKFKCALEKGNIRLVDDSQTADLLISAYDGPQVDSEGRLCHHRPTPEGHPNASLTLSFISPGISDDAICCNPGHIIVKRLANGLVVFDSHGQRLMPDVSGQCCFERLTDYLAVNLGRKHEKSYEDPNL